MHQNLVKVTMTLDNKRDFKIKNKFVATEMQRRERLLRESQMKKVEGNVDPGLESDISAKNVAMLTALFIPAVYPILQSIVGGKIAGESLKKITALIAPKHENVQESADLLGNVLGGILGDPASREILMAKFGPMAEEEVIQSLGGLKIAYMQKDPEHQAKLLKGIKDLAEQVLTMDKGFGYLERASAVGKKELAQRAEVFETILQKGDRAVTTAMYNAQLSNPRIGLSKLLTDSMFLPVQIAFRSLGVGVEHGSLAGVNNVQAGLYAYRESFKDALKYAFATFKEDRPMFHEELGIMDDTFAQEKGVADKTKKFMDSPVAHGWRWIAAMASIGRRFIMSSDQFAKAVSYRAELRMSAHMMALDEADNLGLVGASKLHYAEYRSEDLINSTNEELYERAKLKMFEDTFTDQSKLVKKANAFINQVPGLRLLIPYLRTPAALLKQGMYISPAAPLTSAFRNDFTGSVADQATAVAKWAVGTGMVAWIAHETAKGNITGNNPEGELADIAPHKDNPQSFKVGEHFFGYKYLGPFAVPLSMGADYAQLMGQTDDRGVVAMAEAVGHMMAQNAEDMPFMEAMTNAMHALDSWKQGGTEKAMNEFAGREVSGMIPAPMRILAHVQDPAESQAKTVLDNIKANTPGWSREVPAKRDRFGHVMYPPVGSGPDNSATKPERLLNSLSPVPLEGDTDINPVDKELYKYGVGHTPIPDAVGNKEAQAPISPQQQKAWAINAGHKLMLPDPSGNGKLVNQHDYLESVIKQPWYQNASPIAQQTVLKNVQATYTKIGIPADVNQLKINVSKQTGQVNEQVSGPQFSNLGKAAPAAPAAPAAAPTTGATGE